MTCNALKSDGAVEQREGRHMKITLEMTEDTARILNTALEFYVRGLIGQMGYLVDEIAYGIPWERQIPKDKNDPGRDDAIDRWVAMRENAQKAADKVKAELFPEIGSFGSYGVGSHRASDIAWQTHEVIRHALAWHDHPEGGITVNFDSPMKWADEPLPTCRIEEEP